jgi:hypothetical protein
MIHYYHLPKGRQNILRTPGQKHSVKRKEEISFNIFLLTMEKGLAFVLEF